jgi:TonB family protein
MPDDTDSLRWVSTIVTLAHSLKLTNVAEGIETQTQTRMLKLTAVRAFIVPVFCVLAVVGCSRARRPEPAPAAAQPVEVNPFDEGSTSFVVSGPRFIPGETAIVRVCVSPDGRISRADLIGSSGDKRFDDFALVWARQVKLAAAALGANRSEVCGAVRVEIKVAPLPEGLAGSDHALG